MRRVTPIGRDIAQPQPYQFRRGSIRREVTTGFDDFTQLGIDTLNCIGRVNHFSDGEWEDKKWDDSISSTPPRRYNRLQGASSER